MHPFVTPSMDLWEYDHAEGAGYGYDGHPTWSAEPLDRLVHLVLVDGRLVDMWSEPVGGTRWQPHADRFDAERRPPPPPPPAEPPRPAYEEVLEWLALVVGGPEALDTLSPEPLDPASAALPLDGLVLRARHCLESASDQLAVAADRFTDEEMATVLRRTLLAVWTTEPELVLRAKSSGHTVAGVCWVAGKANGAFSPHGPVTQSGLRSELGLPCPLSSAGPPLGRALQGFLPRPGRAPTEPDLLPLGRADLLTSSTRRMLIRLRDRALDAKRAHGADLRRS